MRRSSTHFFPLFVAASVILALSGCGTAGGRGGDPIESEARSTVSAMAADFQGGQVDDFFGRFDRRDFPDYEAFRERTRDFLLRNRQLNVDIIIDAVLHEGEEVSVQTRWNRSFIDEQGAHKLQEGRCAFIFRRRASGGLALRAIHGGSPF